MNPTRPGQPALRQGLQGKSLGNWPERFGPGPIPGITRPAGKNDWKVDPQPLDSSADQRLVCFCGPRAFLFWGSPKSANLRFAPEALWSLVQLRRRFLGDSIHPGRLHWTGARARAATATWRLLAYKSPILCLFAAMSSPLCWVWLVQLQCLQLLRCPERRRWRALDALLSGRWLSTSSV